MRLRSLALAGMLALPSVAAAQARLPDPRQLPTARFAVTPFVGVQVPYATGDQYLVGSTGAQWVVSEQRAGGPLGGVEVEARVMGPLSVLGSVAYANTGDSDVRVRSLEGDTVSGRISGPETWLARLAVGYRLPEPDPDVRRFHPAGFLVAGPALVRVDYADERGVPAEWTRASNHWGLNLGFHAATTLGSPRLALHFGLEDFLTFWDTDRFAARDAAIYQVAVEEPVTVRYDYSASNILTLRAGLSFRF